MKFLKAREERVTEMNNTGFRHSTIAVRAGCMRNYLYPNKKAMYTKLVNNDTLGFTPSLSEAFTSGAGSIRRDMRKRIRVAAREGGGES